MGEPKTRNRPVAIDEILALRKKHRSPQEVTL